MILWAAGMLGVLSFLTIDLGAVIALMPGAPPELPFSQPVMKVISLIQPTILLTIAVVAGVVLSPRVGLHAPASEAVSNRAPAITALKPQILPGVIAGTVSAVILILLWIITKPLMTADFAARAEAFNRVIPAVCRIFYGGFTEELLVRWGLMTFFVWLPFRIFRKGLGEPSAGYFIAAISASALLFGVGHLGVAIALSDKLTAAAALFVIGAHSIFAVIAGLLYWKKGLESAFIAHITAHVILVGVIFFTE